MIRIRLTERLLRAAEWQCLERFQSILNTDAGVITRNSQDKGKKEGRGSAGCAGFMCFKKNGCIHVLISSQEIFEVANSGGDQL